MTTMTPERLMEHVELVREVYRSERKLDKLEVKVERGHVNLKPFCARLEERLTATLGGAA